MDLINVINFHVARDVKKEILLPFVYLTPSLLLALWIGSWEQQNIWLFNTLIKCTRSRAITFNLLFKQID